MKEKDFLFIEKINTRIFFACARTTLKARTCKKERKAGAELNHIVKNCLFQTIYLKKFSRSCFFVNHKSNQGDNNG